MLLDKLLTNMEAATAPAPASTAAAASMEAATAIATAAATTADDIVTNNGALNAAAAAAREEPCISAKPGSNQGQTAAAEAEELSETRELQLTGEAKLWHKDAAPVSSGEGGPGAGVSIFRAVRSLQGQEQQQHKGRHGRRLETTPQSTGSAVEAYYEQLARAWKQQQHQQNQQKQQQQQQNQQQQQKQQQQKQVKTHGLPLPTPPPPQHKQQHQGKSLKQPLQQKQQGRGLKTAPEFTQHRHELAAHSQQQQQQHELRLQTTPQSIASAVGSYYQQQADAYEKQQQQQQQSERKLVIRSADAVLSVMQDADIPSQYSDQQQQESPDVVAAAANVAAPAAANSAPRDALDSTNSDTEPSSALCGKKTTVTTSSSSSSNAGRSSSKMKIVEGEDSRYKLFLYSGHDTTLMPLLAALGVELSEWPAFASHLVLELWELDGQLYVNALYNGKQIEWRRGNEGGEGTREFGGRVKVRLGEVQGSDDKGAELGWIALEGFKKMVNGYVISEPGYRAECKI